MKPADKKRFLERMAAGRRKARRMRKNLPLVSLPSALSAVKAVDSARRKLAKKFNGRRRRNSANSAEQARERFEEFHGFPSKEFITIKTPIEQDRHVGGIGELVKLVIRTEDGRGKVTLKFSGTWLGCNKRSRMPQLYIEGGDQSVRLEEFGVYEPFHEKEVLGLCDRVQYYTTKTHLGDEGGTAIFDHKFGGMHEVTINGQVKRKRSRLPTMVYDTRNKLIEFAGGGYTIPAEGIDG